MTSHWDQFQEQRRQAAQENGLAHDYAEAVAAVLVALRRELWRYDPDFGADELQDRVDTVMEEWGTNPIAQMFASHVIQTMVKED